MKKSLNILAGTLLAVALLQGPAVIAADKSSKSDSGKSVEKTEKKTEKKAGKKADTYPLDTCIVSGEKLDSMGEPFVFKHEGREVKLCCKSCLKDFKKEPSKYLKKLDEAEKKAKKKK